jgi:hypothetical protein
MYMRAYSCRYVRASMPACMRALTCMYCTLSLSLSIYIYIHTYIYICVYIYSVCLCVSVLCTYLCM